MIKKIEMHLYFVEFTDEWHLDITQNGVKDYYAFENFKKLTQFLSELNREDLL